MVEPGRRENMVGNSASVKMLHLEQKKVKLENVTLLAGRKTQIIQLNWPFTGQVNK